MSESVGHALLKKCYIILIFIDVNAIYFVNKRVVYKYHLKEDIKVQLRRHMQTPVLIKY